MKISTILVGCALASTILAPRIAQADVMLSSLFQDHAVSQAGKPVPIWGKADAGEKVTVSFAGQSVSAVANDAGRWQVSLSPLAVNAEPGVLTVLGNNTLTLQDILVGEVWLCSGQSNMEFQLSRATNAEAEIAGANFPAIRHLRTHNAYSDTPKTALAGNWEAATPATAGRFTAVGYFFAREVHQKLGVPVGLIHSSWGGTNIEAWMSAESIANNPQLAFVGEHWEQRVANFPTVKAKFEADLAAWQQESDAAKAKGEEFTKVKPRDPQGSLNIGQASVLYNGMIAPVIPYAIRGVLWYQGENNAGREGEYAQLMPSLVTGWRQAFGQGDLPFYWVQLPNFQGNPRRDDWAALREAQSRALSLPATGQAITIDVGEEKDIHPHNKQDVGHRLALLALHRTYGQNIVDSGPVFESATFEAGAARVSFGANADGLKFNGPTLLGFELAGEDKVFHPADARLDGQQVVVTSALVSAPIAVRYAWHNAPLVNLTNGDGLPAAPFRSDNW